MAVGALAAAAAAIALRATAPAGGPPLRFADLIVGASFPLTGLVVLRQEPRNRAGWLLVGAGAVAAAPLLNQIAWHLLSPGAGVTGWSSSVGEGALWIANWIWAPYLLLPTLLVLLLPAGRLQHRRWRPLAIAVVAGTAVAAIAAALRPGASDQIATFANPLGISGATFLGPLESVATGLVLVVGGLLCVGGLVVRQRRASGRERAQLQWLLAGAAAAGTAFAGSIAAPWPLGEVLLGGGLLAIPASIAVAVWRHQLFDVELVLNRAVVSLALTVGGLIAYALVVLAAGDRLAPAAAAIVVLAAAALFGRAQRLAERLLFGARNDPYAAVERLGDRLDSASVPSEALRALADTLRETLRLPYVSVVPEHPQVAGASVGRPVAGVERVDCSAQGRKVATLIVGHRYRHERWRSEERSLLVETARRAAAVVQLGSALGELQDSRKRIVVGREEERRRLRRELHDGVASALAGITLQLDCLTDEVPPDAQAALGRLRSRTRGVLEEVHALIEDLRPPALDGLGLADALREQAAAWRTPDAGGLDVEVDADPLPPLPAATELAAYRIALEATANAGRHAGARRCTVRLAVEQPWLVVEVEDDGRGFVEAGSAGVGLGAMRERAVEVGGELSISSRPGCGTRITARLPLEAG